MQKQRGTRSRAPQELLGRAQLKLVPENRAEAPSGSPRPADNEASPLAAPAFRPSLSIGIEPFAAIARELPPLLEAHWNEVVKDNEFGLPLNPDWDLFYDMATVGRLHINTARYQ